MLQTARIVSAASIPQECSSIGRAPVSKTGGRRFEPCHSCQLSPCGLSPCFPVPSYLDLLPLRQYIAATCSRPVECGYPARLLKSPNNRARFPAHPSSEGWANGGCSVPL